MIRILAAIVAPPHLSVSGAGRAAEQLSLALAGPCDVTIAKESAIFRQVGPMMGSFDAGYGTWYLEDLVGKKRAKEIWYCNPKITAVEAKGAKQGNKGFARFDADKNGSITLAEFTAVRTKPNAAKVFQKMTIHQNSQ